MNESSKKLLNEESGTDVSGLSEEHLINYLAAHLMLKYYRPSDANAQVGGSSSRFKNFADVQERISQVRKFILTGEWK